MQSVCILGRQPELGLAELESLFGADLVRPAGDQAAVVDIAAGEMPFARLGGSVKCAEVLAIVPETGWRAVEKAVLGLAGKVVQDLEPGKVQLGISTYGFREGTGQLTATGLSLKKALRKFDRSVRLVPNVEAELSSAQVFHNHLASNRAWEVIIVRDGEQTIIGRTRYVQDIDSYTLRDRGRPKRDSRVGMLPPKLAQTLINFAAGRSTIDGQTVLDPFCGTGVVLQEARLMGFSTYGTDLEQRMIDYSQANLDWLPTVVDVPASSSQLEQGDATSHTWQPAPAFVACETYLGRPFTALPDAVTLQQTVSQCNLIIKKFLRNIHGQLKPGTRLCLAIPAWNTSPSQKPAVVAARDTVSGQQAKRLANSGAQTRGRNVSGTFVHLPLVDSLGEIGYNRVSFEHVRSEALVYYREDQIVARQLIVITSK